MARARKVSGLQLRVGGGFRSSRKLGKPGWETRQKSTVWSVPVAEAGGTCPWQALEIGGEVSVKPKYAVHS